MVRAVRYAQKVAYLVSFLCGPLRIFAGSALKGPLNAETQRLREGKHDSYATARQMRALADEILPAATLKRCLLRRYTLVYRKS